MVPSAGRKKSVQTGHLDVNKKKNTFSLYHIPSLDSMVPATWPLAGHMRRTKFVRDKIHFHHHHEVASGHPTSRFRSKLVILKIAPHASLRSCPLPISPLCPSRAIEAKKQKKEKK